MAANIVDDEMARTVAKLIANATSAIHCIPLDDAKLEMRKVAAGTALVVVLRERNMALAVAPVMPATSTADATQSLVTFLFPARAQAALGTSPVGAAAAPPGGPQMFTLSPETLAVLGARGAATPAPEHVPLPGRHGAVGEPLGRATLSRGGRCSVWG